MWTNHIPMSASKYSNEGKVLQNGTWKLTCTVAVLHRAGQKHSYLPQQMRKTLRAVMMALNRNQSYKALERRFTNEQFIVNQSVRRF